MLCSDSFQLRINQDVERVSSSFHAFFALINLITSYLFSGRFVHKDVFFTKLVTSIVKLNVKMVKMM